MSLATPHSATPLPYSHPILIIPPFLCDFRCHSKEELSPSFDSSPKVFFALIDEWGWRPINNATKKEQAGIKMKFNKRDLDGQTAEEPHRMGAKEWNHPSNWSKHSTNPR